MSRLFADIDDALAEPSSPILTSSARLITTAGRKRTRADADLPTEDEDETTTPDHSRPVNRNLVVTAQRIADANKLTVQQTTELDAFAADSLHVQNIRIFAMIMALNNRVDRLVPAASAFTLMPDFITNVKSYAHGVIFSSKLAMYKGVVPLNHLLDIIKRLRWGLPAGVENDTPKWKKVKQEAHQALTAVRRKIKIQLIASINGENPAEHTGIYDLAEACVNGTDYKITVPLLARLALMRGVFEEEENRGNKFWDKVDEHLLLVAERAKGDQGRVARMFKHFLDKDRNNHGTGAQLPVDESVVDSLQDNIDQAIDERNRTLSGKHLEGEAEENAQTPGASQD